MPIKKRSFPTIEGVTRQMQAFEFRYSISTEEFLRQEFAEFSVNEDDAMQWHYLREQLSALQDASIERLYSAKQREAVQRDRVLEAHRILDEAGETHPAKLEANRG